MIRWAFAAAPASKVFLAAHGVQRHDAVRKIEFREKLLRRLDFVGFLVDFEMRQHQRRIGGEGAQNLPRLGVVEGVETSLERVAVERQGANAGYGRGVVASAGVIAKSRLDVGGFQALQNETDRRVRGRSLPVDPEGLVQPFPMNPDERADAAIGVGSAGDSQNRKQQNMRQATELSFGAARVGDRRQQRQKNLERLHGGLQSIRSPEIDLDKTPLCESAFLSVA